MRRPGALWLVAAVLTPVAVGGAIALGLTSDHLSGRTDMFAVVLVLSLSFMVSGLVAWYLEPENATGKLLAAVGFAWALGALWLGNPALVYTIGLFFGPLPLAIMVHLLLAYPSGRLDRSSDRWLVGSGYALAIGGDALTVVAEKDAGSNCQDCPENLASIVDAHGVTTVVIQVLAAALIGVVVWVLVRRWRSATARYKRALRPVLVAGGAAMLFVAARFVVEPVSGGAANVFGLAGYIAFMLVPLGFLYGLLRDRLARAGVGRFVVELSQAEGPGGLAEALRATLRDPSLELAYWLPERNAYIDVEARPVDLPQDPDALTRIDGRSGPVAAVIHDPALRQEPELLESVIAAARLALENERLTAELRARLDELRASRARSFEAAVRERRRLERDLHDGAQQRLVSVALTLRLAQARLDGGEGAELVATAAAELGEAIEELRVLARGIHPAVLTERGLGPALRALADRTHLPVTVEATVERLPESVEVAAYFVVAEALTNVARYADAHTVRVAVERVDGTARVEIADDGVGGADPARGSGLRGLADRVAALDGKLAVESPAGAGTRVTAVIPCG